MRINLQVTDDTTEKQYLIPISMHDAQKLYQALREIIGDAQYQAQPGQLITVPSARLKLEG